MRSCSWEFSPFRWARTLRSERVRDDACSLSRRWVLDAGLADMLVLLEGRAAAIFSAEGLRWPGIFVISGHRSATRQAEVNPSLPGSLHRQCPSLAADLRVGDTPASTTAVEVWGFLGTLWKALGGRWGGDFRPKPDYNHFEALTVRAPPLPPLGVAAPTIQPRRVPIALPGLLV